MLVKAFYFPQKVGRKGERGRQKKKIKVEQRRTGERERGKKTN